MRFNKENIGRTSIDNYDDDISIDFIDDSPKSTLKQTTDDKLKIIDDKLTRIEGYLKQLLSKDNSSEPIYGDNTILENVQDRKINNKFGETAFFTPTNSIPSNQPATLYAPKNVRPQGSMLEEIQQVLTTQDVMQDPTNANPINLNCSSDMVYDDL